MLESDNYQVALVPRASGTTSEDHRRSHFPLRRQLSYYLSAGGNWLPEFMSSFVTLIPWLSVEIARFEDVCVDFTKMEVSRSSGEPITLTIQEFKTLKCFLLNPDRVFSRGELLSEAWGYENYPSTRTVDNHVLKLRQKIEKDPTRPVHFLTVHRVGYKFVP